MAHTIDHLRELGYTVGIAYGEVAREEAALAAARAAAAPAQVQLDAEPIIQGAILRFLELTAHDPRVTPDERASFIARVTEQTLRMMQEQRDARLELHERAVEIARTMPTVFRVEGFGISITLGCTDDAGTVPADENAQAALASLCDPVLHTERRFGRDHPEAAQARDELLAKGYDVTRPDPLVDVFDVADPIASVVVAAAQTPPDLPPLVETLASLEDVAATA